MEALPLTIYKITRKEPREVPEEDLDWSLGWKPHTSARLRKQLGPSF